MVSAFCTKGVVVDLKKHPLLSHSAIKLAQMIREGEITSVELVEAHIQQIQRVNPKVAIPSTPLFCSFY